MESERNNIVVEDWHAVVNKPVYSSNGKDFGLLERCNQNF